MHIAWVFFCQECQLFTGPIVRAQVMVAERQEVQGVWCDRLVRVELHDLFETMCGGQIGAPSIIELPHEKMHLREEIVAFLDLLERLSVVPAALKVFPQPFKGIDGFLNGLRIAIDALSPLHLAFSDTKGGIGGEGMGPMEIEEVVIFHDGFRVFLFFEERFASLHDDVGVVVLLDCIAQEDLLVGPAQGFLGRVLGLGCTGAGRDDAEDGQAKAESRCSSWGTCEAGDCA